MWPFQKKHQELTLKFRVAEFWNWYSENAARFLLMIDDKRCRDLEPEISDAIDRWLPGMAWVFGPGENHIGHSFTLSGEGVLAKQFIAEYWLSCAPKISDWTFYASRQQSEEVRKFTLNLGNGLSFDPKELWLHLWADEEEEKIDITAWHPLYEEISKDAQWTSLFLLLDEVLGEHGTQNWIGKIKLSDQLLKESVPLWELRDFIKETELNKGWKKYKPTDTYTGYSIKEPKEWLRGDIFVGTTRNWDLILDFRNDEGAVEHPIPNAGIDFIFVAFTNEILPKGQEVDFRCSIEDDIVAVFELNRSGLSLGGATGTKNAYIDLVIFDGNQSIAQILAVLKKHELPRGTGIHYFTKDKANKVIRL